MFPEIGLAIAWAIQQEAIDKELAKKGKPSTPASIRPRREQRSERVATRQPQLELAHS